MDEWRLAALREATGLAGSIVIGLALLDGRLSAGDAAAASDLDEMFQSERWGEDREAVRRRQARAAELAEAERFTRLLAV